MRRKAPRLLLICAAAAALVAVGVWQSRVWTAHQQQARTAALTRLGERIFRDTSLSASGTLACASCHVPEHAFAQPQRVPAVYAGRTGTRNVPSLLDLPYFATFFWDGRENQLDHAVLAAFTNRAEMAQPEMGAIVSRVRDDPRYLEGFDAAFGDRSVDPERISQALLSYLGRATAGASRYDRYAAGDRTALTVSEVRGLDLFQGKADCATCHALQGSPTAFTDNRFHHSNVDLGRLSGKVGQTIAAFEAKRASGHPVAELVLSDPDMAALGRYAVTGSGKDLAAYRTPTLRNVTRTAPYMHDGSVATLDDAIQREIYYRSLSRGAPISLTVEEQNDLRAFLFALEDRPRPATHDPEALEGDAGTTSKSR